MREGNFINKKEGDALFFRFRFPVSGFQFPIPTPQVGRDTDL
jgi:hypothetical protein